MRTAVALTFLFGTGCFAQASSTVTLSNGVQVAITAGSPQGIPGSVKIDLEPASGNSVYRIFWDENGLAVFVYELSVQRTEDGDHFRVTAKAATDDFARKFPNVDAGKPAPTLDQPRESPQLASGDHFDIEIPTDPGVLENITDAVQVRINARGVEPSDPSSPSVHFRFSGLKVYRDGTLASPQGPAAVVAGRYLMFYLPGRGGYFLSAEPVTSRPFVKAGVVDGMHLRFTLENHTYDCYSDLQILPRAEKSEVWVYHDPAYKPAGNWTGTHPEAASSDEFFTAASDSLKWWLP